MSQSLPRRIAKRVKGECLRCSASVLEGSSYCQVHEGQERMQWAERQRQRRARLRAKKRCLDCGVQLRSRGLVRCPDCRNARAPGVTHTTAGVTHKGEIPTRGRWEYVADPRRPGLAKRYTTDRGRGAPTTEERNAEILRDAEHLRLELGRFVRAFAVLTSDEVASLPRIQREEAARETANHAEVAARIAASIHERIDKRGRAECCVCGGPRAGE